MKFWLFTLFVGTLPLAFGQDTLSKPKSADTAHSVKTAALLSTFVPGAGQIYNHLAQPKGQKKAYWKVPLFVGAIGFTGYNLYVNQQIVVGLRQEYRNRIATGTISPEYAGLDNQGLLTNEAIFATQRDLAILGLVFAYGLQVADAAVEAHFVNFDVSEDLSLSVAPFSPLTPYGVTLRLKFQ